MQHAQRRRGRGSVSLRDSGSLLQVTGTERAAVADSLSTRWSGFEHAQISVVRTRHRERLRRQL